jgi:YidC/Oxa1 family membrane protein insertase
MGNIWFLLLYQPLVNALIFLYHLLGGNLGLAIIGLTGILRLLLIPLTAPSLKATKKIQELAPEIEKLKIKHKGDRQALAQAQMDLYKQHGANPAAGCLPQIVQILVLIALFNAFSQILHTNGETLAKLNETLYASQRLPEGSVLNTQFLGIDLGKPDIFKLPQLPFPLPGILVILASITQFISSKMMLPQAKKATKEAQKTPQESDDMAAAMQTQMLYMFPAMTLIIGISFPAGVALYWFVFSLFSMIQQYFINKPKA